MLLGLTGGMACGKSLAGKYFSDLGWTVIDTDKLASQILREDPQVQESLVQRWGDKVQKEGTFDRAKIASVVFQDFAELDFLENLLHPRVLDLWQAQVDHEPEKKWLVEVPLLFEVAWEKHFPMVATVGASPEVMSQRIRERQGDFALWKKRSERQWPVARKMAAANFVLWNNGEAAFLQEQIKLLQKHPNFQNP
ncbi:MAG: dephospho-CoA kinase [Opitutales bacterium]|nr:dephospho-CoA kinase [Opitutales bacterium]